ncbi:hypothetical protein POX_e06675 [Penicillium oxalicum]|uniref:hypothetical protein n=1 Tax=Penicillium oxalicum TaxID=69781 RepID=UPI0020B70A54|nr:hypothetical protein POX_e06675 [Penicillium oxalicum]KAI2788654.1 hypothetical protein POX_e06675 [Penicillium oxalicum]
MGKDSRRERETSRNDSGIDEEKQKNRAEKESEDDSWGDDAGAADYELASSSTIVWMPPPASPGPAQVFLFCPLMQ